MTYQVTTFDLCTQGFERLRSQSEFILVAYPSRGDTSADVRAQWIDDIQGCCRSPGFDYVGARDAIADWIGAGGSDDIARALAGLDWPDDDSDCDDCHITAFLYIDTE